VTSSLVQPVALDEALAALAAGARPVAGGTDLVVGARQGKRPLPEALVAIHRIEALRGLCADGDGLRLGALASHEEIAGSPAVQARWAALADASAIVGSHATRANGTLGGNLMNASPAMETGGPLVCLGAVATLASAGGTRTVAVEELLTGPGTTSARPDELLTEVVLPAPLPGTGSAYVRLEYRRQMEIAVVGATAAVALGDDGSVAQARVAVTALAPTVRRVPEAEAALVGTPGDDAAVAAAAAAIRAAVTPISDVRASAAYRAAMADVIARRAIDAALRRARGDDVAIPASSSTVGWA
jgi:CO/xanthine dehydrogenase FAD-binding subunit